MDTLTVLLHLPLLPEVFHGEVQESGDLEDTVPATAAAADDEAGMADVMDLATGPRMDPVADLHPRSQIDQKVRRVKVQSMVLEAAVMAEAGTATEGVGDTTDTTDAEVHLQHHLEDLVKWEAEGWET